MHGRQKRIYESVGLHYVDMIVRARESEPDRRAFERRLDQLLQSLMVLLRKLYVYILVLSP